MPPAKEADVIFGHVRNAIGLPDAKFVTDMPFSQIPDEDDFVRPQFEDDVLTPSNGLTFFQRNNPIVRHVVLRRRATLGERGPDPEDSGRHPSDAGVALPAMFDGLGLRTSRRVRHRLRGGRKVHQGVRQAAEGRRLPEGHAAPAASARASPPGLRRRESCWKAAPIDDEEFQLDLGDEQARTSSTRSACTSRRSSTSLRTDPTDPKLDAVLFYLRRTALAGTGLHRLQPVLRHAEMDRRSA